MNSHKKTVLSKAALFGATLIWGSSFVIMKNTVTVIPVFYLLTIRFFTGAAVLALICIKNLKQLNKDYLIKGGIMGFLLFSAYVAQTFGLKDTTPGKNAFLTAVYCVMVPFFYWFAAKERPNRYHIAASLVCILGIGLVSLNGGFSIRLGDLLTLVGGVFYALHIVYATIFSQKRDVLLLTLVQFATASLLGGILGLSFETFPGRIDASSVWSLVYLCFFATTLALLIQNIGQKYTPPSTASIILSLESVFGVLFSIVLYHEKISAKTATGFALIFTAILISETRLSFLKIPGFISSRALRGNRLTPENSPAKGMESAEPVYAESEE